MNWVKIGMVGFLAIGTFMLYKSIEEDKKANSLLKYGLETDAIVVDYIKTSNAEGGISYHPKFKYQDESGDVHFVVGNLGSGEPDYSIGAKVKLIYEPNDFNEVRVKSYWGIHGSAILSLILGISFLSVGSIYFWKELSNRKTKNG